MDQTKENPALGAGHSEGTASRTSQTTGEKFTTTGKTCKLDRIFFEFANRRRLQRFQAADIGDTVLNSTISSLQRRHGVLFARRTVSVRNRFGTMTQVSEYWLTEPDLQKARKYFGLDREVVS